MIMGRVQLIDAVVDEIIDGIPAWKDEHSTTLIAAAALLHGVAMWFLAVLGVTY